jgi:A/G-specific adenine glycosylase
MLKKSERAFKKEIWRYYKANRRDLPWRNTRNPYRILVSEIMLQQTQVGRVIPFYEAFIKKFPDFKALAATPISDVLRVWNGLGYNRRALNLKKLAIIVTEKYKGALPRDPAVLETFPGIGKGTAGAISAFAFDKPVRFIETNIRRVFIHFFFAASVAKQHSDFLKKVRMSSGVSDAEILELVEKTLPRKNVREWYYALMDYGAMLGKTAENANRKSKSYKVQPKFKGSNRELRGKILQLMLEKKRLRKEAIAKFLGETLSRTAQVLSELEQEGFL